MFVFVLPGRCSCCSLADRGHTGACRWEWQQSMYTQQFMQADLIRCDGWCVTINTWGGFLTLTNEESLHAAAIFLSCTLLMLLLSGVVVVGCCCCCLLLVDGYCCCCCCRCVLLVIMMLMFFFFSVYVTTLKKIVTSFQVCRIDPSMHTSSFHQPAISDAILSKELEQLILRACEFSSSFREVYTQGCRVSLICHSFSGTGATHANQSPYLGPIKACSLKVSCSP